MGNQAFMKKLKQFGKTLKTAKERAASEGFGGAEVDDGRYKADLLSCELGESKNSGRLQVAMEFKIKGGDFDGETIRKYQSVETEDDQVWLNRDLKRFGVEAPETIEQLLEIIKIINEAQPEVKILLKSKDSGQFCYIDRVLSEVDFGDLAADDEESEAEDEDEDEDEDDDDADSEEDTSDDDDDAEEDDEDSEDDESDEDEDEDEDSEEEEEESEEAEIEVGMTVSFEGKKGKILQGKIVKLMEKEGKVKVKVGKELFTVEAESISLVEEDFTEEEEKEDIKADKTKAKKGKSKVSKKEPAKKKKK